MSQQAIGKVLLPKTRKKVTTLLDASITGVATSRGTAREQANIAAT